MLDGEYKGGLFEGLNQIIKLSDDIEEIGTDDELEQVPYGVDATKYDGSREICEECGSGDCECPEESENDGAAGNQPLSASALLGSMKSGEVGELSEQQLAEGEEPTAQVKGVQEAIKRNVDEFGSGDAHDPLHFFREPLKVDMYEPKTSYGSDMLT